MPCSSNFSMILQTKTLLTETLDFNQQLIFLLSLNSVFIHFEIYAMKQNLLHLVNLIKFSMLEFAVCEAVCYRY